MGKMCEWGRVAMWERCVSGARWQGVKGGSFHSSIVQGTLTGISHTPIPLMMMMIMMMMMNCFCGMVDRRKTFSLISSWDHCQ